LVVEEERWDASACRGDREGLLHREKTQYSSFNHPTHRCVVRRVTVLCHGERALKNSDKLQLIGCRSEKKRYFNVWELLFLSGTVKTDQKSIGNHLRISDTLSLYSESQTSAFECGRVARVCGVRASPWGPHHPHLQSPPRVQLEAPIPGGISGTMHTVPHSHSFLLTGARWQDGPPFRVHGGGDSCFPRAGTEGLSRGPPG